MTDIKITSDFALLDVKVGRKRLAKHYADRPAVDECPPDLRIPVTISGYIDCQHGHDDGESIEFAVCVESAELADTLASNAERIAKLTEVLRTFADIADLIESETEGFSSEDKLELLFGDYLLNTFEVGSFFSARAALSVEASDAQTVLLTKPAQAATVKPLEWERDGSRVPELYARVSTVVGIYSIKPRCGGFELSRFMGDGFPIFFSMDEAKAAAHADYKARVLSSIATPINGGDQP